MGPSTTREVTVAAAAMSMIVRGSDHSANAGMVTPYRIFQRYRRMDCCAAVHVNRRLVELALQDSVSVERVAVIGPGGAGKTTFARELGSKSGLDVIHLDTLFWKPGWVETPREEWRAIQTDLVARNSWIIDGNYGATLDIRLSRAETVVFLDFSRTLCLRRALLRAIRNHGKPTQAEGCPETFDVAFYRWIWNYPKDSRPVVLAAINEHAQDAQVFTPRQPPDAQLLLDTLVRR